MTVKNKSMSFANEYREQHAKKIILNVGNTTFGQIQAGSKTLEMRLKKDSQQKIMVGNILMFKLQTGEDQKPGDEITCEKKVVAVRVYAGLDAVLDKEPVASILPGRPNKKDFLAKAKAHYKKAAKGLDIHTAEFEVIEFADVA
jgi:ASC-1-like (ASCH) protein